MLLQEKCPFIANPVAAERLFDAVNVVSVAKIRIEGSADRQKELK